MWKLSDFRNLDSPSKKWQYHINAYKEKEEISSLYRKKILDALKYLQKHLGTDFLRNQLGSNPLVFFINNKAKHSSDWIIWFVDNLINYEKNDQKSFKALLSKIRDSNKVKDEGIPFIEISSSLTKAGLKVVIEPEVRSRKKPDLYVYDNQDDKGIYIEVSRLDKSQERKIGTSFHFGISMRLIRFCESAIYGIKVLEVPREKEELNILIEVIERSIQKAIDENKVIKVENRTVIIFASPILIENEIKKILAEEDLIPNRIELPISFDESKRIRNNKVNREAKQIPKEEVGMLYFPVDAMYQLTVDPIQAARALKPSLKYYPNIIGAVLYSNILDTNQKELFIPFENSIYSQMSYFEINTRKLLYVGNDYFEGEIDESMASKISESFKVF